MSNDYNDYNYEDSNIEKKAILKKRILIGGLLVVAIIVVIILLKSCSFGEGKKPNNPEESVFSYEKELLEAAKQYYEYNEYKLPTSAGECATLELSSLKQLGLLDTTKFEKCDEALTYVNVCMLEDKTYQWTPWVSCTDNKSDENYKEEKEGTAKDLVKDESLVRFMFLPQMLKETAENLGAVEEVWKDEIKYSSYKTLKTLKYYRYKDQSWIWNTINKTYYTSTGEQTNANNVKEYYKTSPSSKYKLSEGGTKGYKWYTQIDADKVYYMENGQKGWSYEQPEGYPYKDTPKVVYIYRALPIHYYRCKKSASDTNAIDQQQACSNAEGVNIQNPSYTYTEKEFYGCLPTSGTNIKEVGKNDFCSSASTTCPSGYECKQLSVTYYNWYKLNGEPKKTYYPSGSSNASGEKVYYVSAPVNGAIKDKSTGDTVYKWYYQTEGQTSNYQSTSPGTGATKTDKTKWSDWSEWSLTEPSATSYRKIESRIKIQLQQIKNIKDENWEDLSTEYITEEDMIKLLNEKGVIVSSLSDISNIGNLRYKVKMYIRNKKGDK